MDIVKIRNDFSCAKRSLKEKLVHYTSFDGFKGIIEKKELWFTHADFVNDITEGTYLETLYQEVLDEYEKQSEFPKTLLNVLKNHDLFQERTFWIDNSKDKTKNKPQIVKANTYICSFSVENDSLPMWNYYCGKNSEQGINIKFQSGKFLNKKVISLSEIKFLKVNYDVEKQKNLLKNALNHLLKYKQETDKTTFSAVAFYFVEFLREMKYICKNPCFSYEREIRCIVRIANDDQEMINYRTNKQGVLIPYIKVPINIEDPTITVAPLANFELVKKSLEGFLKKNEINTFSIEQSKCPVRW